MRAGALSDEAVGKYLAAHYVSAWRKVGTFQVVQVDGRTAIRQGGNIAVYFCTPDLEVVNAIAGPVDRDAFLREAAWAVETFAAAMTSSKGDRESLVAAIGAAHEKRTEDVTCGWSARGLVRRAGAKRVKAVDAMQNALVEYGTAIQICGGTDAWQTRVIHGATTTNLGLSGCWGGELNGEAVRVLTLLAVVGRNMHEYLGDRGLPKLESIARDVFEKVLGEVVSDEPVSVTQMDRILESRSGLRGIVHARELRGK